jgi:hypothetical protein
MAFARSACWLLVASACACSLDEEGLAQASSQSGGSGGSSAMGGKPSGGATNGGSFSGGAAGESASGSAGAAGSSGGNESGGTAGATAGAAGFAGAAGSTGGSAGATALDCAAVFGSVPHVSVCPDQPATGCKLAYGATLGAALSCDDVCSAAGVTCVAALDDVSNQACVLPAVEVPLPCTHLPNSAVCFCSA